MNAPRNAASALAALEAAAGRYGPGQSAAKRALLARLDRGRLRTAAQVLRLHEVLLVLRASPDDALLLAQVRRMLGRFGARADLRAHAAALGNTGIAGTALQVALFWPMVRWIAARWPQALAFDRGDAVASARIAAALPVLITPAESEWLRDRPASGFEALDRLRPPGTTDAAWFARLIAAMPGDGRTREAFHDAIDPLYVVTPGRDTPSRTREAHAVGPIVWQRRAPPGGRPDLRTEIRRPPRRVRHASGAEGAALIALARGAMLTRERDLDAFSYGDADAVRVVHDDGGLAFALNGVQPERRATVPALFGALTLQNGVPAGYIQLDIAGRSAAVSFNTFPAFRGRAAAQAFARMLAMAHHLFGATSFTVEPYQLGEGNAEGIDSGAWWFYRKLGFRPRAAAARALEREELSRAARRPGYRSSPARLRQLARWHLYFELRPAQPCPLPPLPALGERTARVLAAHAAHRDDALEACAAGALARMGIRGRPRLDAAAHEALRRWAPLVVSMPRFAQWSAAERQALLGIVRAKAGADELAYVRRFAAHPRLAADLLGQPPIATGALRARR